MAGGGGKSAEGITTMTPKTKKRLTRITVWSLTGMLVLAFCPGPVEGNWVLQPPSARNHCGCDSHDFEHYQDGLIFSVHGNHPPPSYLGRYRVRKWGAYDASFDWPMTRCEISGFATLLFRFEFTGWSSKFEHLFYVRDFHSRARAAVKEQASSSAWWVGSRFSVSRNAAGQFVILKPQSQEVALEEVEKNAEEFQTQDRREILIQSDLSAADLQPIVSKLEANGLNVRVVPQVVFR